MPFGPLGGSGRSWSARSVPAGGVLILLLISAQRALSVPPTSRQNRNLWPTDQKEGATNDTQDRRYRPGFSGRNYRGTHPLPRLDWGFLGRALLAPERLHPGVHDRARLYGKDQARVRPTQRQNHRIERRPGREPREVGQRHQGDPGCRAQLPADRGPGPVDLEALRDVARERLGGSLKAHARRQPDSPQRLRDRARQEDQTDPGLSDDDWPQLR